MAREISKDEVKEAKVRTSPGEFIQQTRNEISKVTWPTRKETGITSLMVLIMVLASMLFFAGVDALLNLGMQFLLGLSG